MAMDLFRCSLCGKNKRMEFLGSVLDESGALGNIKEQISYKEGMRTDTYTNYLKEKDEEKRNGLLLNIRDLDIEIKDLYDRVKNSKKLVCGLCLKQGRERAQVPTFVCRLCDEEKQGKGTELHIDDFQDEGISPSDLYTFCRACIEKNALAPPPSFRCPRISDGRDDYELDKIRFDCNCQIKGKTY